MAKQDVMPKFKARIPKSSHNLSHDFGLTCSTGHLLPVFHDLANGGETYELGLNYKIRTQPLAAALMADVDIHTDFFFVPLTLLYSHFETSIFQVRNDYSTLMASNLGSKTAVDMPIIEWSYIRGWLRDEDAINPNGSFDSIGVQFKRLCDCLGFNARYKNYSENVANGNVFPFGLLAYQAVYQYYYRIDDRQIFNASYFNVDSFFNSTFIGDGTATYYTLYRQLFSLHYRPYYLDYFTSMKCSPITATTNINAQPDAFELAKSWLSRDNFSVSSVTHNILTNGSIGQNNQTLANGSPDYPTASLQSQTQFGFNVISTTPPATILQSKINGYDINTANIRALFANEKLWSVTGRARKTYDDQLEAHFGFRPPTDVKHQITHIGHNVSSFRFGEVIQTGGSIQNSPLGEIAGKGYASNTGKTFKFTCPCHGVILTVFSILPRLRYQTLFDKYNQLATYQDFFKPEYDHLGMQPLFAYEVDGDPSFDAGPGLNGQILGWQFRYEHFKRRWNKCTDAFSRGVFKTWMLGTYPLHNSQPSDVGIHYDEPAFLCRPTELNGRVMLDYTTTFQAGDEEDWQTSPELIYSRDPFICDLNIHCIKTSTMSDYSLPQLD